ncbi:hypothetical protein SPRG_19931 [Saprolegnia parasitica CBS 223.65]|uniref:Uncharacterized protein n=1 Tax=Saprolegnia parasitica (strain CBS 223.65) TaxID=695850 RepID=A0A067CSK9_SAPPC|nr:hypothetical protein SPRG_19931 [Saprolegnia parasitica CBS 223.65]KDO29526.1 hypothetical protein SPRG_19931 [Saprolegnia parasitica CBS 223.65]|eukprot:XP_012199776.1 hypothetical protein SPRG_19931 [Saprolegnia parasitica CBS 223.65]
MNAEPTPCGETSDPPYSVVVGSFQGASHNDGGGEDIAAFPLWLPPESFLDELLRASAVTDDVATVPTIDDSVNGIAAHAERSLDDDDIAMRQGTLRVCLADGCLRYAQMNQLCYRHGGRRTCQIEGCGKKDRGNGRCVRHGGGEKCLASGCTRHARARRYCYRHRAFAHDG